MLSVQVDLKKYKNKYSQIVALKDIHFQIDSPGLIMLLGPSGSGKTTLLNIISGNDKDYKGTIVGNTNVYYLRQTIDLIPYMTVMDNLLIVCNDATVIDHYLNQFDLSKCKYQKVYRCSNGQKRRIQLISALLIKPSLLLMDEINASLDKEHATVMMHAIITVASSIPVIMVTHDEYLARRYASRIIRIEGGQLKKNTLNTSIVSTNDALVEPPFSKITPLRLSFKLMKSRPWMMLTKSLLILCFYGLVLCTLFLISTTSSSYAIAEAFRNGSNIIVSLPNESLSIEKKNDLLIGSGNFEMNQRFPYFYANYDLYDIHTIQDVIQMHTQIYAVEAYYDGYYEYSPCSEFSACVDPITYEQYQVQRNLPEYQTWYQNAFRQTENFNLGSDRTILGPFIIEKDASLISNSPDFTLMSYSDPVSNTGADDTIRPLEHRIHIYTLVNNYDTHLPLQTGNYPTRSNELMVDLTTAQWIMRLFDLTKEELIGYELPISIVTLGNRYSFAGICNLTTGTMQCVDENGNENSNPVWYTIPYTITGICDSSNDHLFIGYSGGTIYDSNLYHINVIDPKELKFHYVHFMVDPLMDTHDLIPLFNGYFNPQYGGFQTYSDLTIDTTTDTPFTSSPLYLLIAAMGVTGILLMLWILTRFDGKTIRKTNRILKLQHYKPTQINGLNIVILGVSNLFLISLILLICLPIIKNHFTLIYSDFTIYLFTFGLTLFIMAFLWINQQITGKQRS